MIVNGYETKTTFWDDFTIADAFGVKAIKDTYKRAFDEWKDNYIYLTELVLVTNWKCWQHYEKGNTKISELYGQLFHRARNYALSHLKGEEFQYFFNTTD